MAIVRVSRSPITPEDKKASVDLKIQYNSLLKTKILLAWGLGMSIILNLALIVIILKG